MIVKTGCGTDGALHSTNPEEGEVVGGVEVPHHGPGGGGQVGHEVLVLGRRGVVHRGPDGDPVRGVEHHPDDARTVLGHAVSRQ